ncbi:sensor histidine kinase [Petropleomorpha daqingensis]|uniref:histidine kinase n=1 Tax=Petropleomorpha daqingensis TaxID=2026353 RepID=A0A853CAQ8_9ACTN|nr:signal transduction histidine kinase [Petropleomorpha daqingensis]
MTGAVIADRVHAARAALLRGTGPVPLSRWAWTADVFLGAFFAAALLVRCLVRVRGPQLIDPMAPLPPEGDLLVPGPGGDPFVLPPIVVHPWELVLAVLCGLPLAVRRRYPLAAFWLVLSASLLFHVRVVDDDTKLFTFAACLVAAYSAAMYSPYRLLAVGSVAIGAALIAVLHDDNVPDVTAGYVPFLLILAIGLGANSIHTWKQRVGRLEAQQQTATRIAVEDERARIARELHDVVTHNVSVMVIQAGAARKVMDAEPGQAREALLAVEAGGRAALAELRHVMDLLTTAGDEPDDDRLAPQPGLGQLPALVSRVRGTGVPVELTVTGTPAPIPAGVDLAAYRVVQEGLTNAVRHAAGARVRITVEHAPDAVLVEVADTGGAPALGVGPGNGRGLIGLRERLAVLGGTLEAGPRLTGGYRVRAVLPVAGS